MNRIANPHDLKTEIANLGQLASINISYYFTKYISTLFPPYFPLLPIQYHNPEGRDKLSNINQFPPSFQPHIHLSLRPQKHLHIFWSHIDSFDIQVRIADSEAGKVGVKIALLLHFPTGISKEIG